MSQPESPLSLPRVFCWSRFGPEAGEPVDAILERKELERQACGGVFFWGIGSAVGPAMARLVADVDVPEVLFSPIRSAPRLVDTSPSHVVRWAAGTGLFGEPIQLPSAARVTSRWDPARPRVGRYALVCASVAPLTLEDHGSLRFRELHNLVSGAPLGASQVTAVVRRADSNNAPSSGAVYRVALRVRLTAPYLLRLSEPRLLDDRGGRHAVCDEPLPALW